MIGDLRTVFLDRDGVINRQRPGDYVTRWEEFEFLPRAKEALALLSGVGLRLIVVTNQRGVARGVMTAETLWEIHQRMLTELVMASAPIAAVYACTHEEGECTCRKPQIGLFERARASFPDLAFNEAAIIGDSLSDLDAGSRLGCRSFLVADEARAALVRREATRRGIPVDGTATSLYEIVRRCILVEAAPVPSVR